MIFDKRHFSTKTERTHRTSVLPTAAMRHDTFSMDELQNLDRYILQSQSLDSLPLLLNAISDGAIWLDANRSVRHINLAARSMLGWEAEGCLGCPLEDLLEKTELNQRILDQLYAGEMVVTDRFELLHLDGHGIQLALTAIPSGNNSDAISGAILIFRDISLGLMNHLPLEERESLVHEIFSSLPVGILLQNQDGTILRINETAAAIFHRRPEDLLGRNLTRKLYEAKNQDGEALPYEEVPFRRVARSETRFCEDVLHLSPVDSWYLVYSRRIPQNDSSFFILTTFARLDSEKHVPFHESIRFNHTVNRILTDLLAEEGGKETIETALAGVLKLVSADTALLYYKKEGDRLELDFSIPAATADAKAIQAFEDYKWPTLDGKEVFSKFQEPRLMDPKELEDLLSVSLARHGLLSPLQIKGESQALLLLVRPAAFALHELAVFHSAVAMLSAALRKADYSERIQKLALTDSLTGLNNRRSIVALLDKEILRSKRNKHPLSALLLDLDYFKNINDSYGHLGGDDALVQIANLLRTLIRKSDHVARYGGEEFLILLPESNLDGALVVAEKIRSEIEKMQVESDGRSFRMTTSIGCATREKDESRADFIKRLDKLLYLAKDNGRNCIVSE